MKTNVYLGIGIRIIVLFSLGMFWTYIPEQLTDFFGDKEVLNPQGLPTGYIEYGLRHYWYNVMMGLLFVLSLFNVVVQCINIIKKNYDTKNW
jgi:isoprenylcysteine carboxyl methyltransferase (ICMT) family protein YpbQ